jgi:Pyruvate/2-oxoacid:ferredoxin oxidoreductase delta subunit
MLRPVVRVDTSLCNRCGRCLTTCPNEALELVMGRATLTDEMFCAGDALCVEVCGALWLEHREAAPFDAAAVEQRKEKRARLRALAEEG